MKTISLQMALKPHKFASFTQKNNPVVVFSRKNQLSL